MSSESRRDHLDSTGAKNEVFDYAVFEDEVPEHRIAVAVFGLSGRTGPLAKPVDYRSRYRLEGSWGDYTNGNHSRLRNPASDPYHDRHYQCRNHCRYRRFDLL
jgi:hypothetical protein